MSKKSKINAVITMNNGESVTNLYGNNIDEIVEKILEWHTMTPFVREHLEKRGRLNEAIKSGWYTKESTKNEIL